MRKYFDTILDPRGEPVEKAEIRVTDANGAQVQLYSDNAGAKIGQPVLTNKLGYFEFFVGDGIYTFDIRYSGAPTRLVNSVEIYQDSSQAADIAQLKEDVALLKTALPTLPGATALIVGDRSVMANIVDQPNGQPVYLTESGREGSFVWRLGDYSAQVAADPDQDFYVEADAVGADTGAWVRSYDVAPFLSAPTGSSLIGFTQSITGAVARTVQDKDRDVISVMDFIPEAERAAIRNHTSTYDCTDAFNAALEADAAHSGNDTVLKRKVVVPHGTYVLGTADAANPNGKTVYVRKGQHLSGEGVGCYLNCLGANTNTVPVIQLGPGEGGVDPGGLGAQISGFWVQGGPAGAGVVDTTGQPGWWIDHMFFTSCGIGVLAGGGDGLLSNCQFDEGLTGIFLSEAGNVTIWGCNFYNNNYGVRVVDSRDVEINGNHFEYQKYNSILVGSGDAPSSGGKGIAIRGNSFLLNEQHETFTGFIALGCQNTEVEVLGGNTFRNCAGAAIRCVTGPGNKLLIQDALFDGKKTFDDYTQSTTMIGVDASNMDVTIRGAVFRDLPGQPVVVGGTILTRLAMSDCSFVGNTGGTTEISITNTFVGSSVNLSNIEGDDRLLFNAQADTPISAQGLKRWLDTPVVGDSRTSVKVPVQQSAVIATAIKANAAPSGDVNYRKSSRLVSVYGQDNDGSTAVTQVNTTEVAAFPNISGNPALLPKLDIDIEIGSVGGGTSVNGHPNSGYVVVSWPNSYDSVTYDVQLEV